MNKGCAVEETSRYVDDQGTVGSATVPQCCGTLLLRPLQYYVCKECSAACELAQVTLDNEPSIEQQELDFLWGVQDKAHLLLKLAPMALQSRQMSVEPHDPQTARVQNAALTVLRETSRSQYEEDALACAEQPLRRPVLQHAQSVDERAMLLSPMSANVAQVPAVVTAAAQSAVSRQPWRPPLHRAISVPARYAADPEDEYDADAVQSCHKAPWLLCQPSKFLVTLDSPLICAQVIPLQLLSPLLLKCSRSKVEE